MSNLEQLAKSIQVKLQKYDEYNKKVVGLMSEATTAGKHRDAMKISAGKDLREAKAKTEEAGIAFATWCKDNKITRSKAYEAMAAAGDDDPDGSRGAAVLKQQREAAAERMRRLRAVPNNVDVRDNKPAPAAPVAPPVPINTTGDVIEFKTPNVVEKRQATEFEKAEIAQAHFFRQLGEDEFAELLISGLELIAGRPSFDKVVDWGIEWRQIQKDKARGTKI